MCGRMQATQGLLKTRTGEAWVTGRSERAVRISVYEAGHITPGQAYNAVRTLLPILQCGHWQIMFTGIK